MVRGSAVLVMFGPWLGSFSHVWSVARQFYSCLVRGPADQALIQRTKMSGPIYAVGTVVRRLTFDLDPWSVMHGPLQVV